MSQQENDSNDENLRKEAPLLFGMKKEEPFQAPDGYFEKFAIDLSNRMTSQKISWWNFFLKPVVWAPSMVILIVGGIFLFKGKEEIKTDSIAEKIEKPDLNSLSFDVLDAYVNDHLLALANTDEIMEMVGEENIPSLGTYAENSEIKKEEVPAIEHIESKEMEEYILENMDDLMEEY